METNIVGVYEDEQEVLQSISKLQENKVEIADVFSPYASHDIIHALHLTTRLWYTEFIYGTIAITSIFAALVYVFVIDYPLNIGGKPSMTYSFVIIMFVGTILLTALASVLTFFLRQNLGPGKKADIIDPRISDDKFAIVVERTQKMDDTKVETISQLMRETGASEVNFNSVPLNKV